MTIELYKLFSGIGILLLALSVGLPPLLLRRQSKFNQRLFDYANALSKGIFLGAGFCHLLPEASAHAGLLMDSLGHHAHHGHHHGHHHAHSSPPIVEIICLLTIVGMLIFERGLQHRLSMNNKSHTMFIPLILTLMISLHALIEGLALGIEAHWVHVTYLLIAISAHKGSAAFAISVQLRGSGLPFKQMLFVLMFFAFMTPLGVLFGHCFASSAIDNIVLYEVVLDSIAAGTFIYVATLHDIDLLGATRGDVKLKYSYLIWFMFGALAMAALAILL